MADCCTDMHNNLNEIPIFLYCLRCGLIIGVAYDIFRIPRRIQSAIVIGIADTLFGLFACAASAATLLYCDNGTIRMFSLFGIALGALIWQLLPGRLLRSCIARVSVTLRSRRAERMR